RSAASIARCGTFSASRSASRYGGSYGAARAISCRATPWAGGAGPGRAGARTASVWGGWAGPEKVGEQLSGYIAAGGFGAVKMRVGIIDGDPRHSARRVRAAREGVGPEGGTMCVAHRL